VRHEPQDPPGFSLGVGQSKLKGARVHDFARDGVPELVIDVALDSPDHHTTRIAVWRVVDGVPAEWSIEPPLSALEDVDGDGVLDLLSAAPFESGQGMNDLGAPFMALTRVGAGGALDTTSEAVKAYYQKQCPARVGVKDVKGPDYLRAAACAWLYGAPVPAIRDAVLAQVKKDEPDMVDLTTGWWSDDDAKPPLVLP